MREFHEIKSQDAIGRTLLVVMSLALVFVGVTALAQIKDDEIKRLLVGGDTANAEKALADALTAAPTDHVAIFWKGRIAYAREDFGAAYDYFVQSQGMQDDYSPSLYYRALSEIHTGRFDDADASIRKGAKKAKTMRIEFKGAEDTLANAKKASERNTGAVVTSGNGSTTKGPGGAPRIVMTPEQVQARIAELEGQVLENPRDVGKLFTLGKFLFEQSRFAEAEAKFNQAIAVKAEHDLSLYYLGQTLVKTGRLDAAEEVLSRRLDKAPDYKAEYNNGLALVKLARARLALEAGQPAKASEFASSADENIRLALSIDSTRPEFHLVMADANLIRGVYQIARAQYMVAIAGGLESGETYANLAEACFKLKDYTKALAHAQKSLEMDSSSIKAWRIAGTISFGAARAAAPEEAGGHYKNALASFRKYLELTKAVPDSSNAQVFYELALTWNALGIYDTALVNFQSVQSVPFIAKDMYAQMGKAFAGLKEYDSALVYYANHRSWLAEQPADFKSTVLPTELDRLTGQVYFSRQQFTEALPLLLSAYAADTTVSETGLQVALCYHNQKQYRDALPYYRSLIARGISERGWSIYLNGAYAVVAIANEKEDSGTDGSTPADPSDTIQKADYFRLAAAWLEKVVEYKPDNDKAISLLATTYLYDLGECESGVKYFKRAVERDPNDCEALRSLGYAYFGGVCNKEYGTAINYLTQAMACIGNQPCKNPQIALWLAQTYHLRAASKSEQKLKDEAKADFKMASDWYGKVLVCQPGNSEAKRGQDQVRFEF